MKKSECIKILSYLSNYYNNRFQFPKNNDDDGTEMMIEIWFDLLQYYNYPLAAETLKKLVINHSEWPPTPGDLIKEIEKAKMPKEAKIPSSEAWHLALQAVRKYGYYNPKEGMDSLPPTVREAVRNFGGFTALCHSQDNSYVKSQFMKIYQEVKLKNEETAYLPAAFQEKLLLLTEENKDY